MGKETRDKDMSIMINDCKNASIDNNFKKMRMLLDSSLLEENEKHSKELAHYLNHLKIRVERFENLKAVLVVRADKATVKATTIAKEKDINVFTK